MADLTKAIIRQDIFDELKEECNAHLDALIALADSKAEYFAEMIKSDLLGAGFGRDKTLPITTIQKFIYHTKAYTAEDAESISSVVNNSIEGFIHQSNKSIVTTILSEYVKILFGSSESAEQKIQRYFVVLEGYSVIRLDFVGWSRSVSKSLLKTKCDKVSAFVLYKSVVDISKVSLNDFIAVYQETVKAENKDINTAELIKKCQELYYIFNSSNRSRGLYEFEDVSLINESESFLLTEGYEDSEVFRKNLTVL